MHRAPKYRYKTDAHSKVWIFNEKIIYNKYGYTCYILFNIMGLIRWGQIKKPMYDYPNIFNIRIFSYIILMLILKSLLIIQI